MKEPLISIITVVYNAEPNLEPTILSIINQSYKNIEYIIVDGNSTDGTLDILNKYKLQISKLVSEPDLGVYDAMNKGIDIASGDWIYFLNAGDILLNVLGLIVSKFENPTHIYYGDVYMMDKLKIYDGPFSAFKLAVRNICHQSIFYPSTVIKKYKFDLKYPVLSDHNTNMMLHGNKAFRFIYLPILVCLYKGDGISSINSVDHAFFSDKLKVVRVNFSFMVYCYVALRRAIGSIKRGLIKN